MEKKRGQQTAPALSGAPCERQQARSGGALKDRIALITGASRGIGQAVAGRFAAEGAQVILAARDKKGLEETDDAIRADSIIPPPVGGRLGGGHDGENSHNNAPTPPSPYGGGRGATLATLDLTNPEKIEALAAQISTRFGKLDILVGNAGTLGELTPVPHLETKIWDQVIAVNLSANFHLIRCFDALLKQSSAPRAMFVTSGVTEAAFAYFGAYAVAKSGLEKLVETYAAENVKTKLRVNLIDPGIVATRMRAAAMPGEDPDALPKPDEITDLFVKLASPEMQETGKKFHV